MLISSTYPVLQGQTNFWVANKLSDMMEKEGGHGGRVFLVVEEVVAGLYPELKMSKPVSTLVLPSRGEGLKNMDVLCRILSWLNRGGARRDDRLLLAGGGSLLDVGSLAGSLFNRGLPTVLVPTTVLAQVDAAVGGKCAVNFGGVKNKVGHFHFPLRVYCATEVLSTLSPRHFLSGLGEIWKYSILWGLDRLPRGALQANSGEFAALVTRCVHYKSQLVERDPRDLGQRRWLNMGHTLAHALEAVDNRILHGEAVLWGLEFAMRVSIDTGNFNKRRGEKIITNLRLHPRPKLHKPGFLRMWQVMNADKKKTAQGVNMVLPGDTEPVIAPCSFRQLLSAWDAL